MRLFLDPSSFKKDTVSIADKNMIHQLTRVIRLSVGEHFIALDNSGAEYDITITAINKNGLIGTIVSKQQNTNEPAVFVTLYQALPKKQALFELILQKCTEIGVSRFVPIITKRTERNNLTKHERLTHIIREAAEQSERGKLPVLMPQIHFKDAINNDNSKLKLIAHSRFNNCQLSPQCGVNWSLRGGPEATHNSISLYIGPEGGFAEEEIAYAQSKGATIVSLGPRILRIETAAIALAAKILL